MGQGGDILAGRPDADGVVIGRSFSPDRAAGPPLDVGERPQRRHQTCCLRLRSDARGGDGRFRQELAQDAIREGAQRRPRRMMPLERTGAFTLACVAVLLILGA
jgi:hypothetical protein